MNRRSGLGSGGRRCVSIALQSVSCGVKIFASWDARMLINRLYSRCCCVTAAALSVLGCESALAAAKGLEPDVVFTDYAPLSDPSELERRVLSPLHALRTNRAIPRSPASARDQSIDLAQERFALYVPSTAPPADGYALLVFVPPWEEATVPPRWTSELDRHVTIFVTAANSGNKASVLDRREPLALLAAHNVMERYHVDPSRVYVGGFSGGSRVAMRLALGYPDLFHGALLNAGSDPIGNAQIPLPTAELMHRFQESTRLVYLTGGSDTPRLEMDRHSRRSMQEWCVFDVRTVATKWASHELAEPLALGLALDALETRSAAEPSKLQQCRRNYELALESALNVAERSLDEGKSKATAKLLERIDERFGGLATPRSVELTKKLLAETRRTDD